MGTLDKWSRPILTSALDFLRAGQSNKHRRQLYIAHELISGQIFSRSQIRQIGTQGYANRERMSSEPSQIDNYARIVQMFKKVNKMHIKVP